MADDTLAIIGGGNMARALIGGLLQRGHAPGSLRVADPLAEARIQLAHRFPGISIHEDNLLAVEQAPTWILAVKPWQVREVCRALAPAAARLRPEVISFAAGIHAGSISAWLGSAATVIRSMPNTPALIGQGITALFAGPGVVEAGRERAVAVLSAVGECVWVDEEPLMDAVTAVSGSGPAYVYLLIEMLEQAACAEGLDTETARRLVLATVSGAARMAQVTGEAPAALRKRVTTPGGTTDAAMQVFERADLRNTFLQAIHAATLRGAEMARESAEEE